MVIRRARRDENDTVRALVQAVVDETYGGLLAPAPLDIGDAPWHEAWVAADGPRLVGMIPTDRDWVEDLWVLADHRGRGIGRDLLLRGEADIAGRGHGTGLLRVFAPNVLAIRFYEHAGWRVLREVAHERFPVPQLEMGKTVARPGPVR